MLCCEAHLADLKSLLDDALLIANVKKALQV